MDSRANEDALPPLEKYTPFSDEQWDELSRSLRLSQSQTSLIFELLQRERQLRQSIADTRKLRQALEKIRDGDFTAWEMESIARAALKETDHA